MTKRKKQYRCAALALMMLFLTAGCGKETVPVQEAAGTQVQTEQAEETAETAQEMQSVPEEKEVVVRIGAMKGPTTMGLVYLMHQAGKGETQNQYSFTMETAADTLLPRMIKGELDIALLPANAAGILYQKSDGGVSVVDINTLGVLYVVSGDDTVTSVGELKGKTLYLTGKGTTPDYVIRYLLKKNGLSEQDVKLEYKSEPAEIVALLAEDSSGFGLLPQPFATAACMKNTELAERIDITKEWDDAEKEDGSRLVTGVTVVRKEFLERHPDAVERFLKDHEESAEYANAETEDAAELIADFGIIDQAEIAAKALPKCNIVCLSGEEMQKALSGYLEVLYEYDPQSVGGELPEADFYWQGTERTE